MPDERRRRFEQIERPRGGPAGPVDPAPDTDARFEAVEGPAAPPAPGLAPPPPPVAPGQLDRFRPAVEPGLELDTRTDESQPFVRCQRCETDNTRFTARCTTCGSTLDTEAQLAFNERLWSVRRAEAAALARVADEREANLTLAQEEAARARRAAAEAMAREVGERERLRLAREGLGGPELGGWPPPGGGWPAPAGSGSPAPSGSLGGPLGAGGGDPAHPDDDPDVPAALRLLGRLPGPAWRLGAGVALLATPVLLYLAWPWLGVVAGVAVLVLFRPARWRSDRW